MARIRLKRITEEQAVGRPIFYRGMMASGFGGHNYLCGHCNAVRFAEFDLAFVHSDFVFKCPACSGFNERAELVAARAKRESPAGWGGTRSG
jgi:hypothetical protein